MPQATLEEIRHSASHVLAQAVLQVFPDAKLGIGPVIDEGFYYDFGLSRTLTTDDLLDLESRMRRILAESQSFHTYTLPKDDALRFFQERDQPYKQELIEDLNVPEYSFYENGPFIDLCKGPHVANTSEIPAIKLMKISGAYWRGDEKRPMLQRIYGTAFHTQAELDTHLQRLEEAQKRDHRVLGKALDLFSFQDDIGPGLVLWHPKGAIIRSLIEDHWRKEHYKAGYDLLYSPHVGRSTLWETSGHLSFYRENMYAEMTIDEQSYFMKPMNCPFHIKVYESQHHSYRDLPLRYAELGTVYRYERSGVLHGLMRVRGFTQDDAHIMCTPEQVRGEILNVLSLCNDILTAFGFHKKHVYLSTRPKEKYVGDLDLWGAAESALEDAIKGMGWDYSVDDGGGAFYGPKIDIKIEDAIGRLWQCSTIQFDFNLPERFDMTYVGSDGQKHRPIVIHRALFGSLERFFGILIEHYEGKFPVWLAPVQIKLLNLSNDTLDYTKALVDTLRKAGIRVAADLSDEKLGYKIRMATTEKVPFIGVIGKKEAAENTISLRTRGSSDSQTLPIAALIPHISEAAQQG
jgi:threonyl-tRNA synthetase